MFMRSGNSNALRRAAPWAASSMLALAACGGPIVETNGDPRGAAPVPAGPARTAAEILAYQPAEAHLALAIPPVAMAEERLWRNAEAAAAQAPPPPSGAPSSPQVAPADALAALRKGIESQLAAAAFRAGITESVPTAAEFVRALGLNPNLPGAVFSKFVPGVAGGPGKWHFAAMAPVSDPISAMALTQRLVVEHMGKPVPEIITVDGIAESVALFSTPDARLMVALDSGYLYLANDPALLSAAAARRRNPEPGVYGSESWPAGAEDEAVLLADLNAIGPGLGEARLPLFLEPWVPAALRRWNPADAARTYDFIGISASLAPEDLKVVTRGRVRSDSPFVAAAVREMDLLECQDEAAAGFVALQFSPETKESLIQKMRTPGPASPETPETAQWAAMTGTLLGAIDDEVFLTVLPHPSGVPQIRLVAEVADPVQVRNMAMLFGMPAEPYGVHRERDLYRFAFGFVQAQYTFDGNRLIAASNEADLKTLIDRMADAPPAVEGAEEGGDDRWADMVVHIDGPRLYGSLELPLMFMTGASGFAKVRDYLPAVHAVSAYHGAWHEGSIRVDGSLPLLTGAYLHAQSN